MVEETSQLYAVLGERPTWRYRLSGLSDAIKRQLSVVSKAALKKCDVVYLTASPSIGFFVRDVPMLYMLKATRRPVIVHMHGGYVEGFLGRGRLRKSITASALRSSALVITITQAVTARLREVVPPEKVVYIPNMVPDAYVDVAARRAGARQPDGKSVLFVGAQTPAKGVLSAIRALSHLGVSYNLVLAGAMPDEYRSAASRLADQLGVAHRIKQHGELSRGAVDTLMAECAVLILPSATEGFPMAILEAMSHGLPVVATRVGDIPNIIGEASGNPAGLSIPVQAEDASFPANPEELAVAVAAILESPGPSADLGRNATRRIADHYRASVVLPALEEVIADVVRKAADAETHHRPPLLRKIGRTTTAKRPDRNKVREGSR